MPATAELRREVYEIWNAIAPTWERRRGDIEEWRRRFALGWCPSWHPGRQHSA